LVRKSSVFPLDHLTIALIGDFCKRSTVPENWFYAQRGNDGKNGKTLKHDFKKNSLSERERH
ncbi:hypothetical protein QUA40_02620, partial [Microcoleus sp. Pol11C3]|uniref:hypothetical protein n=1 Tax=Microcoleus sp. Pol11C3 TaxID=3055390 RepID=UPI002FD00A42